MNKFEELFSRYKNLVYYIAIQRLHDNYRAEDCVQEVFMFLFKNIDKIENFESSEAKNYVAAVTRGKAISMYRRQKREYTSFVCDLSEAADLTDESVLDSCDLLALSLALEKLDEEKQNIVVLKYYYGLKSKEIGDIYGISDALVRKRLQYALKELKQNLGGEK